MKIKLVSSLALLLAAPQLFAANDLHNELAALKAEIAALQQKVEHLSQAEQDEQGESLQRTRRVTDDNLASGVNAPHFGIDATYDGASLLINEPSINKDIGLLKQKQYLNKAYGSVEDNGSRVMFSGTVGSVVQSHRNPFGKDLARGKSDIIANAELDFDAQLNDWWTAYSKFEGNSDDGVINFDHGLVTWGNLDSTPYYGTIGKFFVPNGYYSSRMVSSTLPKLLARTKARAITLGAYYPNGVKTALFTHVGNTHEENSRRLNQWGANVEYKVNNLMVGASFFSNLANSDGMQTPFNARERIESEVPAFDIRSAIDFDAFGVSAEYVSAVKNFDRADMTINNRSIKPNASMIEAYYKFDSFGKSSYVATSYGRSTDSLGLKMPNEQVGATYSVDLFKNTVFYLEYLHKSDYGKNHTAQASTGNIDNNVTGTGRVDRVLSAEIDVYF